jgi:hypothetical protein
VPAQKPLFEVDNLYIRAERNPEVDYYDKKSKEPCLLCTRTQKTSFSVTMKHLIEEEKEMFVDTIKEIAGVKYLKSKSQFIVPDAQKDDFFEAVRDKCNKYYISLVIIP